MIEVDGDNVDGDNVDGDNVDGDNVPRWITRLDGDGTQAERYLRYTAIRGDDRGMVPANSYAEEGWTVERLIQARPVIKIILKASPLPDA